MRKLLTIKHWQLVALVIVPALLMSTTPLGKVVSSVSGFILLAWLYSIGYYGQQKIGQLELQPMNLKLFQLNVLLLPVLMIIGSLMNLPESQSPIHSAIGAALGLYSGFAAFQVLLFAGKTLAKLEYQREVSLNEYYFTSLQIVVFILGVWNLQPRINRQFAEPTLLEG